MRSLGDDYVSSEFRRHQKCEKVYIDVFMREWTEYLKTLTDQTSGHPPIFKASISKSSIDGDFIPKLGKRLDKDKLETMSNEQLGQLHVLQTELRKIK